MNGLWLPGLFIASAALMIATLLAFVVYPRQMRKASERHQLGALAFTYQLVTDEKNLRDEFAMAAVPLVAQRADIDNTSPEMWAAACYDIADAMLKAREPQP